MASIRNTDVDGFASALGGILDGIGEVAEEAANAGVKEGLRVSAKEWRANAPKRRGKYAKSIRYRMDSAGEHPSGHVYSTMPGLPHLLEKGHAKMGGGRVAPRVHIAPAAESGFEAAADKVEEVLDGL